jgi:hypothetical protein
MAWVGSSGHLPRIKLHPENEAYKVMCSHCCLLRWRRWLGLCSVFMHRASPVVLASIVPLFLLFFVSEFSAIFNCGQNLVNPSDVLLCPQANFNPADSG